MDIRVTCWNRGTREEYLSNWTFNNTSFQAEMGAAVPVEDDAIGVYKIEITETPTGTEKYFIEVTQEVRRVRAETDPPERKPDVWVSVASSDLASVLDGSLSPLQVMARCEAVELL